MTVKELKEVIADLPDEMWVIMADGHDSFCSPCLSESGELNFCDTCDEEGNILEDVPESDFKCFALLPHAFAENIEKSAQTELN